MISVYIPNNFIAERKYIIDIFFKEFLGLTYDCNIYDGNDYMIVLENKSIITIKDAFFSSQDGNDYLRCENIPSIIKYISNQFILEENIPILYGTDLLQISSKQIVCGIDIFASSFFMLTRWEEYVIKERDLYNRFPATASIAYKNDFLKRPIVNEYTEMLWNIFLHLGIKQKRKKRQFQFVLTHDVDFIKRWSDPRGNIRNLCGDIIKRNIPSFLENLFDLAQVKLGKRPDPFDTFDYIMDLSESANIKSHFYFMSGGVTKYDNFYKINDSILLNIIEKIKERNHVIGFHPSFSCDNDPIQWKKEKELLEEVLGIPIKEGRQHFLRFQSPTTWKIWDDNEMERDSTLGYADCEGFRCGTCYEFPVFDFINRIQLKIKESPLIAMEVSFTWYQQITPEKMEEKIKMLLKSTKKYNGNFVFLWHNSSFNTPLWRPFQPVYENIIKSQI
jgi:hypothetical protein